jgi:hypothetical protein
MDLVHFFLYIHILTPQKKAHYYILVLYNIIIYIYYIIVIFYYGLVHFSTRHYQIQCL